MTPREIIALAIGLLVGAALQGHGGDCTCRSCCKRRWEAGGYPEPPKTISSEAGRIMRAIDKGQTSLAKHLIVQAMVGETRSESQRGPC